MAVHPVRVVPAQRTLIALCVVLATVLALLVAGLGVTAGVWLAAAALIAAVATCAADVVWSVAQWRQGALVMTRHLPSALAIAVRSRIRLEFVNAGSTPWTFDLYDHADPSLTTEGLPRAVAVPARSRLELEYAVTPTRRGDVSFGAADVKVRSRLGTCDLLVSIGTVEQRRVYPDFSQVSRYAWLAGNRRLQEIGVKTYQQRGEGTDFKQLAEYRPGDAIRHIDWRASLRLEQPIVRQFQDDRDQTVLLLVDCGRRMRADEAHAGTAGGHFDHVLNAVMLLTYVALRQGDAVGALTCGAPGGRERSFAPRKGAHALNALMSELYDVQPALTHADYLGAAEDLLRRYRRRALVVVITNFRDEDSTELRQAVRLLRSRHLVLVASLRERVIDEMMERELTDVEAAIAVASAHLHEQSRRDRFHRLAARDALMVDALPERLGVELVNRYNAVKRSGLM
ncbi:MAG TPA: DUF58 domain-containing protein [Vicinamibacterales bacterium]|nr:DUF58 domain-containing protein [Vicinamibacterales bacterium]